MFALMMIQFFQGVQLYDRKSKEFRSRSGTTLDRIALNHEKAEDIRRYLMIANKDFSIKYKDILKEEFKNLLSAKESIQIEDTTVYVGGQPEGYLIIKGQTYDSVTGVRAEQRVMARDVRQLRDLFSRRNKDQISPDTINLAVQLDQRVIHQIFKKARFVNEMMLEAFRNNVYMDPSERIDVHFLDSVISTELAADEFPQSYRFLITDEFGNTVGFKSAPKTYRTGLDTSKAFSTLLFPSNSLDENLYLHLYFPKKNTFLFSEMWIPLLINLALVALIIFALSMLFRTILTQKKLSEMKNDFISNMTHEFKTPISTISLACQAMTDRDLGPANQTYSPYIKMIADENSRLETLVERILQSSTLDRGELNMKREEFDLVALIEEIVEQANFRLRQRGVLIETDLPKMKVMLKADRFHTTNLLSNLVDNAIKYSPEKPEIKVQLTVHAKEITVRVQDKGIGIKKEHLAKIFDKLYRVPTGNIHNVKGFGLGLSYVKAIADLHGWNLKVKSKFGEGSEFSLFIKM